VRRPRIPNKIPVFALPKGRRSLGPFPPLISVCFSTPYDRQTTTRAVNRLLSANSSYFLFTPFFSQRQGRRLNQCHTTRVDTHHARAFSVLSSGTQPLLITLPQPHFPELTRRVTLYVTPLINTSSRAGCSLMELTPCTAPASVAASPPRSTLALAPLRSMSHYSIPSWDIITTLHGLLPAAYD
jgi:hypothetical protein